MSVETVPYEPLDCSAESLVINDKNIDHQLSSIYDEDWGVWSRKDRSKQTHKQIQFLWNKIHKSGFSISEISRQYKLAPSTLYKIQKLRKQSMLNLPRKKFQQTKESEKIEIKRKIMKLIDLLELPSQFQKQKLINREVDADIFEAYIKAIMKDECNLSYVRWKSRPNSIDTTKVILSRNLFAIDFLQVIDEHTLVVNIDDSVVSRNTTINYAWSIRGISHEYKNSKSQGSISVIMAILSNGWQC